MSKRVELRKQWRWCAFAACATLFWQHAAMASLVDPVTDHEFRLTVQNPFDSKTENDITSGFGTYMNTESLLGAGEESSGQQNVTISPNLFSAELTTTVTVPGAISATTAEVRFRLDEPTTVSFSGSAAGGNGQTNGFNIRLRSRTTNELLLFADGGSIASINWSTVNPLVLPSGLYEFTATSGISNQRTGTHFNNVIVSFTSTDVGTPGDFNGDGDVDLADLDQYNGNIGAAAEGALEALDLDGNGTVEAADFIEHYTNLVETSNGGTGTFAGDADLDGDVDVLGDAFALVNSLGRAATSWSEGDFDASENVDVLGDAFALVGNLGQDNGGGGAAAPSTSAIP